MHNNYVVYGGRYPTPSLSQRLDAGIGQSVCLSAATSLYNYAIMHMMQPGTKATSALFVRV